MKLIAIILFLFSLPAQAYIPPGFFLLQKITENNQPAPSNILQVRAYKYIDGKLSADPLWERFYSPSAKTTWPLLALAWAKDLPTLMSAVKSFSIPVPSEQELLRHPLEKVAAMPDMPRPFYNRDKNVSLRRFKKNIVWVMGDEKGRSLWIDRDNFKPLFVRGTCPSEIGGFCSIEILNAGSGKIFLVRKEEQAVVQFKFEKSDAQKTSDYIGNSSDYRDSFQSLFLE